MSVPVMDVETLDLSASEAYEQFNDVCMRRMNMNADEFVRRYRGGAYDDVDVDDVPGLARVIAMLPFAGL